MGSEDGKEKTNEFLAIWKLFVGIGFLVIWLLVRLGRNGAVDPKMAFYGGLILSFIWLVILVWPIFSHQSK